MLSTFSWPLWCLHSYLTRIESLMLTTLFFSRSMWLLWCCTNALVCSCTRNLINLPFIATPSIITISSLNGLYGHMSCFASAVLDSQHSITYGFRFCKHVSFSLVICMAHIVMHLGMSAVALMAFVLMYRPAISSSLFSSWFCLDSLSEMYRSLY